MIEPQTEDEWPNADESLRAAWGLFAALDRGDYDTANAVSEAFDAHDLERGLTLVAAVLCHHLKQHADALGCDCGSDAWLEAAVLRAAATDLDDPR